MNLRVDGLSVEFVSISMKMFVAGGRSLNWFTETVCSFGVILY